MCSRIWKRGLGAVWIALAPACGFLSPPALAQCATSGNNQVCTNPAGTTITNIFDSGTATVTNLGTISPGGITGQGVNLTNAGTVQGASVAIDVSTIHLLNLAGGTVTGTNVGTEFENGTIVNNGTISGGIAVAVSGNAVIVNSGSIISLGGAAAPRSISPPQPARTKSPSTPARTSRGRSCSRQPTASARR
jgi:hypothetical protein